MSKDSLYAVVGDEARRVAQKGAIRSAMLAAGGDQDEAAKALGIGRRDLARLARSTGIDWEKLKEDARAGGSEDDSDAA